MEFIKQYALLMIVIVNSTGIVWAMITWSKGLRQTWMNDLRNTGSLVLGTASHWKIFKDILIVNPIAEPEAEQEVQTVPTELRVAMADFNLHSNKLLMLFRRGSDRYIQFEEAINNLKYALIATGDNAIADSYSERYSILQILIHDRIYEEWNTIKDNIVMRFLRFARLVN